MKALSSITKHFNRTLALSCALIALSQMNYGFDNQAFSTTQSMTAFTREFGVYNPKTKQYAIPAYYLSLLNSLNYIGFAVGLVLGSLFSEKYGRRLCMFVMSCYALVTATITVTSQTKEQILAARILNYIYIGFELSVVPVYQSEIVPAPVRGFIVGTYQLSINLGGLIINSICRGTSTLEGNKSWRIPFGLFYVIPTIIICLIWFIPESPRWLLRQERVEEAEKSLKRLRHGTMNANAIAAELTSFQVGLAIEPEKGAFKELFQGVNRKRTAIVIAISFFQQATGQAFASQYGAIFIKSLGTINTYNFTIITSCIGTLVCLCSNLFNDKVGRRKLFIAGGIVQAAALFTMGGLGTARTTTRPESTAIASMVAIFGVGFGMGWAPLTYVVVTELPALSLRDHSQRISFLTNIAVNFVVTFSIPYLLDDEYAGLHSKVGFIFGSIAVCACVFVYFCVPDCQGKSLEEVDRLFHEGVPVRNFRDYELPPLEDAPVDRDLATEPKDLEKV
ncbi:putative sugar transporter [Penicillium brasilianum]|uniref:Putative sugar transporter n=1 Tax=Penicillium brasilianum TaxID=104259 RepID=A0A1S9RZJ4_PENBI|nr:putative sugar transporter [Penicillium brasilianum]